MSKAQHKGKRRKAAKERAKENRKAKRASMEAFVGNLARVTTGARAREAWALDVLGVTAEQRAT